MAQNNMPLALLNESVWLDKYKYDDAEVRYYKNQVADKKSSVLQENTRSLVSEIADARKRIQNSLKAANVKFDHESTYESKQIQELRTAFIEIKSVVSDFQNQLHKALERIQVLESRIPPQPNQTPSQAKDTQPSNKQVNGVSDDDDIDLFGSDEDESATKLREERLKAYETKKSKKGPLVAKSSVVLDVKPWDDETDMKEMEAKVREVQCDGLVWGASKLVPLAYGIQKLQIVAVVEDDKVSIDWLQETIQEFEDYVQSVDVAAFNKL